MTRPVGRHLASGRHADVFEYGSNSVLRRYRNNRPAAIEAEVMRSARAHGYPVPEVDAVHGPDLIMERVPGRTMLSDLIVRPWKVAQHATTLLRLHEDLHQLRAPDVLGESPFGAGDALLHLDLQPENVLLSPRGPVVIDWTFAARGPAVADMVHTSVQIRTWEPTGRLRRAIAGVGRQWFGSRFTAGIDPSYIEAWVPIVCRYRLEQRELTPTERARLCRIADTE